ncbi:MAG: zinc ribbon domain-containing protein [Clostridia bacterium]|nr:zinc ribbon domain-containing protein [Clostridia bacterium]
MADFLFSGKIFCGLCDWKYRGKTERNKKVYLCSKYSKTGDCERYKVDEQHLLDLILHQLDIYGLSHDRTDLVESIIVTRKDIEINYTGYASTIQKDNEVTFATP